MSCLCLAFALSRPCLPLSGFVLVLVFVLVFVFSLSSLLFVFSSLLFSCFLFSALLFSSLVFVSSWGSRGVIFGRLGVFWAHFWLFGGSFWALVVVLGRSWGVLGALEAVLARVDALGGGASGFTGCV